MKSMLLFPFMKSISHINFIYILILQENKECSILITMSNLKNTEFGRLRNSTI